MVQDLLKSASITNLDASPVVSNTSGVGATGPLVNISDYVTPTAAGLADTTSKYKVLRVNFSAKLKALSLAITAAIETSTGLALNVGAYYSDSTVDGTPVALQGTAISVNCFASALTSFRSSALGRFDALGAFSIPNRNKPLWQALGLASNPGGSVDIVVAVQAAATGAASVPLQASAEVVV